MGEGGELHAQEIERTCGVDIALRWVNGYDTTIMSFVNIVETPGGGTHVDGFMNAITKQIRKAVEDNARKLKVNMKDSAMKVERDDIQAGLVAVVTARVAEPQFQGQTKDVLGTAQVKPIVTRLTDKQFGEMITGSKRGYKEQSGRVLEKIVGEMHARIQSRKAKEVTRRKNALESASMPAKLSDCQPGNDDVAELFIVEGDSALGTAKAARNAGFQALLPIRGKILNVQKASITQMLSNKECAAIIQVVGAGSGQSFDIEQSRYHKIIMMTDADVDGAHIRILLLTLFYRYMRPLIEHGYVYAAVPPLHRIALTGSHKGEYIYTYSDDELAGQTGRPRQEAHRIQRRHPAIQGSGRDGRRPVGGHHHGPAHAYAAPHPHGGRRPGIRDLQPADGRRRAAAQAVHRRQRRRFRPLQDRYLIEDVADNDIVLTENFRNWRLR